MAALEPYVDQDELFIDRHLDLEWADDVHAYRCTRCDKVLVQHYIANCEHKFCGNCKRVVDDGSQRWRCPNCREFIKDIDRQNAHFKDKVIQFRVHCPNRNYGCQHICPFKDIKEHLAGCEHTKERALPVLYPEGPTVEMLERMFSAQLLNLRNEMKRKLAEMEKRDWDLSVQADEMQRVMLRMEKRQKDGEERVVDLNERVDGVRADLNEETARLDNDISNLQKRVTENESSAMNGVSSQVEENKSKISKLEGRTDAWLDIIEVNKRENAELIEHLKIELDNEVRTKGTEALDKFEQTQKATREEMMSKVDENSSQILAFNAQLESLGIDFLRELQNQVVESMSKVNERFETTDTTLDEMQKSMKDVELAHELKREETNARFDRVDSELRITSVIRNDKIDKITEDIVAVKEEHKQLFKILESNEDNCKQSESQLQIDMADIVNQFSEKISKMKQKLKKAEAKMRVKELQDEYRSFLKPELQRLRRVSDYYTEAADFTWVMSNVRSLIHVNQNESLSAEFPLNGYPFTARAKIKIDHGKVTFSLSYNDVNKTYEKLTVKPFPSVYFTLKDRSQSEESKDIVSTRHFSSYAFEWDYNTFYNLDLQYVDKSFLYSPTYNADDEVEIDIHVEAPEVAQMVYSYDGTLTWTIDDYWRRKRMAAEGLVRFHLSPYFYTSPNGYRVQVSVWLNGCNEYKDKGVSVFVSLLNGVYDEQHARDVRYEATVTVFHPNQPHRNISKSVERDYRDWYNIDMGSHEEIEDLLYKDSLCYKVTVEAIKHNILE